MLACAARLVAAPFAAANHEWLEAFVLALVAASPARSRDALRAALALAVGGAIFWSGIQKVAHGYWLPGEFFVVSYAQPESKFATALDLLASEAERAEAAAFREAFRAHVEAGVPGVLDRSPPRPRPVVLFSRAACALTLAVELIVPPLLFWRRTRRMAAIELAIFLVGLQAIARELVFGALVTALLLPLVLRPDFAAGAARPGRAAAALLAAFFAWPAVHLSLVAAADLNPWKLAGWGMYSVPARLGAVHVDVRVNGAWRRRPPRDEAEGRFFYARGFTLRVAPFASGAARAIARRVLTDSPVEAVRVRAVTMRYDRETRRFTLEERAYIVAETGT